MTKVDSSAKDAEVPGAGTSSNYVANNHTYYTEETVTRHVSGLPPD
jgi:hypothetical protein